MRSQDIADFKRDLKRIMDYYQIGLSIKIKEIPIEAGNFR
jgi:hypothetical protein